MPTHVWIAYTVSDLIQGDVREHLPLELNGQDQL